MIGVYAFNGRAKILFSHDIPLSLQQVVRVVQSVLYQLGRHVANHCQLLSTMKIENLEIKDGTKNILLLAI